MADSVPLTLHLRMKPERRITHSGGAPVPQFPRNFRTLVHLTTRTLPSVRGCGLRHRPTDTETLLLSKLGFPVTFIIFVLCPLAGLFDIVHALRTLCFKPLYTYKMIIAYPTTVSVEHLWRLKENLVDSHIAEVLWTVSITIYMSHTLSI